jgi:hypothetical protein
MLTFTLQNAAGLTATLVAEKKAEVTKLIKDGIRECHEAKENEPSQLRSCTGGKWRSDLSRQRNGPRGLQNINRATRFFGEIESGFEKPILRP